MKSLINADLSFLEKDGSGFLISLSCLVFLGDFRDEKGL
jgi:hypothetical protein